MKIKLLDKDVYSKIAAGEVIERPASIVRELIDNSLDSGATEVTIKVEEAGVKSITIVDNGCGIERDELLIALEKHSTSKIECVDDLYNISTMGFRGEALHSIKTISKITIASNTDETGRSSGYKIDSEKGFAISPVACKRGTRIEVRDVFYNLPVRKKFLKSNISELNAIKKILINKVFGALDCAFRFYNDNRLIFSTSGDGSFENAFFAIYKNEKPFKISSHKYRVDDQMELELFYSEQDVFFSTRKYQLLFVNGRPIHAPFFYSALDLGARNYISPGRFPLFAVFLKINPGEIDINIHPAKKEIKFVEQNRVFNALKEVVSQAYSMRLKRDIIGSLESADFLMDSGDDSHSYFSEESDYGSSTVSSGGELFNSDESWGGGQPRTTYDQSFRPPVVNEPALRNRTIPTEGDEVKSRDYHIMGVVFDTYITVEKDNTIYFIDQHAVDEAFLFMEKKRRYLEKGEVEQLIIPIVLDIHKWNDSTLRKLDNINNNRFCIERGEGETLIIREIPSVLLINKDTNIVIDLIADYFESDRYDENDNIIDRILIEASCRQAVKKGDNLTLLEISRLVDIFFDEQLINCPHGRPVYFELKRESFEKAFQRKK